MTPVPITLTSKSAPYSEEQVMLFEGAPSIEAQKIVSEFSLDFSNLLDTQCLICNQPVSFGEGTTIPGCQHSLCLNCVAKGRIIIRNQAHCPVMIDNNTCRSVIPIGLLRNILPAEEFEIYQRNQGTPSVVSQMKNASGFNLDYSNLQDVKCLLCEDLVPFGLGTTIPGCDHSMCLNCVATWIVQDTRNCPIMAGSHSCSSPIPIGLLRHCLPDEQFEHFQRNQVAIKSQEENASGFSLDFSNMDDIICFLCKVPVPFGKGFTIPGCGHSMCQDCTAQGIVQEHCPAKMGHWKCSSSYPSGLLRYIMPPDQFKEYQRNKMEALDDLDLVLNTIAFECSICFERINPGDGCVLRDCVHEFCLDCLRNTVKYCEEAKVACPFADYSCRAFLQEREVRGILGDQAAFEQYIANGLRIAEARIPNTFHCLTADCKGWCVMEDGQELFQCEVCGARNCLLCQVIGIWYLFLAEFWSNFLFLPISFFL